MNYLETGLPHTQFFPQKSRFDPPRFIPLCGLGRKYLGLEPLPKRELDIISNRLCKPKKVLEPENPSTLIREKCPLTNGTGRFVGQKRMTGFQIEKMVDRLYQRRATKDFAFVDDTVGASDILNMTDRCDSSSESEDENDLKTMKEMNNSLLRRESCVSFRKDSDKTDFQKRRESSVSARRADIKSANGNYLGEKVENPNLRRGHSVSFRKDDSAPGTDEISEKLDFKRLKLDIKPRGSVSFNRETSQLSPGCKKVKETINIDQNPSKFEQQFAKQFKYDNSSIRDNYKTEVVRMPRSPKAPKSDNMGSHPKTSNIELNRQPRLEEKRAFLKPDIPRPATASHSRPVKTDTPRSPRQLIPNIEESKLVTLKMVSTTCDDQLIDKVATFNSPQLRCK